MIPSRRNWIGPTASLILVIATFGRTAEPPHYPEHQNLSYYLDPSGTKHPVKTTADWEIRRAHVLANMQIVMGPLPDLTKKVPLDVKVIEEVTVGNLTRKKLTYQSDAASRVAAYLFLPPMKPGEKRPAVLCLHPTGAAGKGIVSGTDPTAKPGRGYALELAQRGYVILAPDYPSFGDATKYDFDKDEYVSGTMKAIWDNIRAVDLLQSLPQVDGEKIGCIGHSLGGHNTMFTAAFEPRIKVMVSSCGFTRFHKYYEGKLAGWTSPRYMPKIATDYGNDPNRVPFDFPEVVGALAPRPFFINAPTMDSNFENSGVRDCVAEGKKIYDLYGAGGKLVVEYPEDGHAFPDAVREKAYSFLDKWLGR